MDTKELIKKVKKIEIKSKRISDQLFAGEYHSAFKGQGMSFSEVREYVPGDEIRSIDWNVTARTGIPHIKTFEEERELTVMLLVDVSGSTYVGSDGLFRRDFIAELAAVLAFAANRNNDKVGLILFADDVLGFVPPAKGSKHSLRIVHDILKAHSSRNLTDINAPLQLLNKVLKKSAICFLISDMISAPFERSLKTAARKHDFIALWTQETLEKKLPKGRIILLEDAETGHRRWVDPDDASFRTAMEHSFQQRRQDLLSMFYKNKASIIELEPNEKYANRLMNFFKQRSRK